MKRCCEGCGRDCHGPLCDECTAHHDELPELPELPELLDGFQFLTVESLVDREADELLRRAEVEEVA